MHTYITSCCILVTYMLTPTVANSRNYDTYLKRIRCFRKVVGVHHNSLCSHTTRAVRQILYVFSVFARTLVTSPDLPRYHPQFFLRTCKPIYNIYYIGAYICTQICVYICNSHVITRVHVLNIVAETSFSQLSLSLLNQYCNTII